MYASASTDTPFHIDLTWWELRGRNMRRFLAEMLKSPDAEDPRVESAGDEALDYIHPETAEVFQLDPLWVKVLIERAHKPDYITSATPLTNAVLRALIENLNRPMTATELYRRINRTSPEVLLKVLRTARTQYGIVPADR